MKQSIRVGLCGFGFMGKTHLYALSNLPYFYDLPYRAEVIGVCTAHRGRQTLPRKPSASAGCMPVRRT